MYDRMCWPEADLIGALAAGAHRRELAAYLGEEEYRLLASLARRALAARARIDPSAPRVYLLPGILGSQLGRPRGAGEPPDLLWLDPADILAGRLSQLRWHDAPDPAAVRPLGAIVYTYLRLRLRLAAAGFDVIVHDYDWRSDLRPLGAALAARLDADPSPQLALIGHSMGGLLARVALAACTPATAARVRHVIGLGTPHGGAIGAVQTLRATYPLVCRLAAIDPLHDAATLTREVFSGFASLYQLLPADLSPSLLSAEAWPSAGARPDARLLAAARDWRTSLATPDSRFTSIVGLGQRTVTGVEREQEQFRYEVCAAGDGTVAAARATPGDGQSYSLRCEHSQLPRKERIALALVDLLRQGRTARLQAGVQTRQGRRAYATDAQLLAALDRKLDWQRLNLNERRHYFDTLSQPPALYWPAHARAPAD